MRDYLHLNTINPKGYDGKPDTSVVKASKPKTMTAYGLFTEDGLDGIEHTDKTMRREAKDLREMGCTVKVVKVVGTDIDGPLDLLNDLCREAGRLPTKSMIGKVQANYPASTITMTTV